MGSEVVVRFARTPGRIMNAGTGVVIPFVTLTHCSHPTFSLKSSTRLLTEIEC